MCDETAYLYLVVGIFLPFPFDGLLKTRDKEGMSVNVNIVYRLAAGKDSDVMF